VVNSIEDHDMSVALLRKIIETANYDRLSLARIQPLLPAGDKELEDLIEQFLAENARVEFRLAVLAALAANRPVNAKYLVRGTALLIHQGLLSVTAMRMHGDVARYLLEALDTEPFDNAEIAVVLLLTAIWCREVRNIGFPPELFQKTREVLRLGNVPSIAVRVLVTLALYTNDEGLLTILRKEHFPGDSAPNWEEVRKRTLAAVRHVADKNRKPLADCLPEKEAHFLAAGNTMRRSVAKCGRNEQCPCGSGKKYKRCCLENDNIRLRRSTDIAGVTLEEIGTVADQVFSPSRMDTATIREVQCINPLKLPPVLLERYVSRLTSFRLFDRATETFEKIGYSDHLMVAWNEAVEAAAIAGRKDVVARLLNVRKPDGYTQELLPLVPSFLMMEDDPDKCLAFLEDKIRLLLESNDLTTFARLAYTVSMSKFPALGVALARGIAPLLSPADAADLMQHVLRARDRLKLSPEDEMGDVLDTLALRAGEETEASEAYREAQARFEAQQRATRTLLAQVEAQKKEMKRLEQSQAPSPVALVPAAPTQAPVADTSRLERKIKYLEKKLEISRQEETRRRHDMQGLQAPDPGHLADTSETAREGEMVLAAEKHGTQPVRLLDFSRDFEQQLSGVPRQIARGTMSMLGRLAGGEAAAFAGVVRLKLCPAVMRHRIGQDWRLLFRILPDRIDAVDLIPRQDLERRIKTLVTQYA
jgi:hypothetical protein